MKNPFLRSGWLACLPLAFGPGAGIAAAGPTLFGTVAEVPQYIPVPGAWVYLWHSETKEVDSVKADTAGAYRFTDVAGCELACYIQVRAPVYWTYTSDSFSLGADGGKQVDAAL